MHTRQNHIQSNSSSYTPTASSVGSAVQTQLTVGAVDDPLEKEADEMADKVMRMPAMPLVQRKCAACEEATKSAGAIGASAYPLGNNIVFGVGEFQPGTAMGTRLLTHELSHVVQQRRSGIPNIHRKAWIGTQPLTVNETYKKTVRETWGEKALRRLIELHTDNLEHRFANWGELIGEYERAKKTPDPEGPDVCANLPSFGQRGPTCAAASLITPALIWDKEQYRIGDPNSRLRNIAIKMKKHMLDNKEKLLSRYKSKNLPQLYQMHVGLLDSIEKNAATDTFQLTEDNYKSMGLMLMLMSQDDLGEGLSTAEMGKARQTLGFPAKTTAVLTFEDFFKPDGELAKMKPGQMAQLTWFIKQGQPHPAGPLQPAKSEPTHAFTIGRLQDGTWILNDQGYPKPLCLNGADLASLKDSMIEASESDKWWGVTDNNLHKADPEVVPGYTVLGNEKTLVP